MIKKRTIRSIPGKMNGGLRFPLIGTLSVGLGFCGMGPTVDKNLLHADADLLM